MSKNTLVAVTGPTGFRKGILIEEILKLRDDFVKIVSYTDRPKRQDEIDGIDFHFVSDEQFTSMIHAEEFVEWQRLAANGYRYGKTKRVVAEALNYYQDKIIFTHVNIINLPVFKRYYPDSKSIFIDVKDTKTLVDLLKANPEIVSEEEFDRRYKVAIEERRRRHLADFIYNMKDSEEDTIQGLLNVIDQCTK